MNISCLCCGTCCRKYQPRLTADEVRLISAKLEISAETFIKDYTDHRWPGTESFLLIHKNDACLFLQNDTARNISLCSIHAFKPACCWDWDCGIEKPECQQGLKTKFGINVDASGKVEASPEQLNQLKEHLQLISRL
jgi:uncharacterized protein